MPVSPFKVNQEYVRRDIHLQYGGNWQRGICPSAEYPFIFIFTGRGGSQHGYHDGWENEYVFGYTGEGQSGNMNYTRGNLALRDHVKTGKRVFLFQQTRKAHVKYISEMVVEDSDTFPTFDTIGAERIGIKFFLRSVNVAVPYNLRNIPSVAEPGLHSLKPTVTERMGLVLSRVGQGAYRKSIINRWENKCAVTGHSDSRILIASHIHPWNQASPEQRLDVDNGILLSPTYDALFDRHLITFENSGKIVLSDSITEDDYHRVGVSGQERIQKFGIENQFYLEKHQAVFHSRQIARDT